MSTELISRARSGDPDAFRALTEPHRTELRVHCYRMLGSLQDAEDALQDTMLDAWRGLPEFEERASLRTWLYRIATHRCLDVLRAASRRPAKQWDVPMVEPIQPTSVGEVPWLEPIPDALFQAAVGRQATPAVHSGGGQLARCTGFSHAHTLRTPTSRYARGLRRGDSRI